MLPLFSDERTFAVSRQVDYRDWKPWIFTMAAFRILQAGTSTISSLIAGRFGDASNIQLAALLTAGFVLFLITLGVNTIAAIFVGRSRT